MCIFAYFCKNLHISVAQLTLVIKFKHNIVNRTVLGTYLDRQKEAPSVDRMPDLPFSSLALILHTYSRVSKVRCEKQLSLSKIVKMANFKCELLNNYCFKLVAVFFIQLPTAIVLLNY